MTKQPSEMLQRHRESMRRIVSLHRTANPRVFGSVLRGADTAGMRNRMAHGYFDINLDLVWDTLHGSLPDLDNKIARLIASAPLADGE